MSDSRSDRRAVGPALLTAGMMAYWRVTPASALLKPVAGAALPDRLLPLLFAGTVWVMARVMAEMVEIPEENAQFV